MKHTIVRLIPFGGFDIPGLEGWLAECSAQGLRFAAAMGPIALFERSTPLRVQVHLEPIQGPVAEDPELNAIYEQSGWQYWGMFRGSFFVYVSSDLDAQAHTDPDTLDYALRKFFHFKLACGLLLLLGNLLLLGLYGRGAPWEIDWVCLRYYPVETLSDGMIIPFLLAALGFFFVDLSYLLGLIHLLRYRKAVKNGTSPRGHRGLGWLLAAGLLLLLPVLINTVQLFSGLDYRPYDLEGSGFVTLTDLEGADFRIHQDPFYNMDYISHHGTLLNPEHWYFQQYGSFSANQSPFDVPRLEISITRYPLEILAEMRCEEWSRQYINGSGDYETLEAAYGLDEIRYAPREKWIHTNELTGETRTFLPGGIFILRRGTTVLFADYYGEQNLLDYLPLFAATFDAL
ncbi:hypothetical protein ACTQ4E_05865 [Lawsonibacter sp. LCP25S3_G6]|uniref:hypothetical protein n=1 Tax=unclassified Lawsonibacter TaxID=2617946 RepID=UPI003F9E8A91